MLAEKPWFVLLGLVTALLLEVPVNCIRKLAISDIKKPVNYTSQEWEDLITPPEKGGRWLGRLERIFSFLIFLFWIPEGILAWLAFKVASKWEVWQNIIKVPEDKQTIDKLKLSVRRAWGSRVLQSFLIGTLGNLLAGFFGAVVTMWLIWFTP